MDTLKKLEDILRDFFDDETLQLTENTVAGDIKGWDSLEHITLMAVIEHEFNIRCDMSKHFDNVGALAREIERLQGNK